MNDEIKEAIMQFQTAIDFKEAPMPMNYSIDLENAKILLNYITNLQQENEEWAMIFDTFSKRPYAHKYLEEKRKELGNDKIIGLDSEMIYKDYYDYKSKVEKASEDIKDIFKDEKWYENYEYNDLENALKNALNILQNGSDGK